MGKKTINLTGTLIRNKGFTLVFSLDDAGVDLVVKKELVHRPVHLKRLRKGNKYRIQINRFTYIERIQSGRGSEPILAGYTMVYLTKIGGKDGIGKTKRNTPRKLEYGNVLSA